MTKDLNHWTKEELKIYILLLCAKIDNEETPEEIQLIKSKTDDATFNKVYSEFCCDVEDDCFEKIEDAVNQHEYSPRELNDLKAEILEVFVSDNNFSMKEQYLKTVFDNILY